MRVNDLLINVIRKKIKNLYVAIVPSLGKIRVAAPVKMEENAIRLFVISKIPWINKHIQKFKKTKRRPPREYLSGEDHYFQGKRYLLNVIHGNGVNKVILRDENNIDLIVKKGCGFEQRHRVMTTWYRKQMQEKMQPFFDKWEKIIGVEVSDYRIKKMKTKWGTCNVIARRIWLNLELIKKPAHCMEYIIVHELVHLLERRHNSRFFSYMDKFLPKWRHHRDELNTSMY